MNYYKVLKEICSLNHELITNIRNIFSDTFCFLVSTVLHLGDFFKSPLAFITLSNFICKILNYGFKLKINLCK